MKYDDLSEARLPLYKDNIRHFGADYGAFVITMLPQDFLALTTSDQIELDQVKSDRFPIPNDEYAERSSFAEPGKFQLPFLDVEYPTGVVRGHEGRHRAAMIARQGGEVFPVGIFMREQQEFELQYKIADYDNYDEEPRIEWFTNHAEAMARKKVLVDFDYGDESSLYNRDIKIIMHRGGKLRGCPERSDPSTWSYAPWQVSDFPINLIGQYNKSVVVPKSRFKVGLMKGGRHFPIAKRK